MARGHQPIPIHSPIDDLATPEGSSYTGLFRPGQAGVNAPETVIGHKFRFTYKGHIRDVTVAAVASDSQAEIEDKAAEAMENFVEEIQQLGERKRAPTYEERQEVAAILRQWKRHRDKRNASTNHKLYY